MRISSEMDWIRNTAGKQRRILRWFWNCWEKCETFDNQKVLANNFLWGHFFPIISTDLKSGLFICKKMKIFGVIEYIYCMSIFLELVECKFARNGITNWKTSLANIFKNIIWHLFAGESHQVLKITVTNCTLYNLPSDLSVKPAAKTCPGSEISSS